MNICITFPSARMMCKTQSCNVSFIPLDVVFHHFTTVKSQQKLNKDSCTVTSVDFKASEISEAGHYA